MSTDIEKEIARLMAIQASRQPQESIVDLGDSELLAEEMQVVEVAPAIQEPIVKEAETVQVNLYPTNAQKEVAPKIFNWCKTRLNIVLVQSGQPTPTELRTINGSSVYMNLPLSTIKISEEVKHVGYLNKFLRPFAKALKTLTTPNAINQLGTATEAMQFYKNIAINILENTSGLLPREPEDRIQILGNIVTEKNNFVNDIILEFYLVYETDYLSEDLLEKLAKIELAVQKDKLNSEAFSLHVTSVFGLNAVPSNLNSWYDSGYKYENYVDTQSLPTNRDERLLILGAIPNTKQPVPHIILSKKV